MPLELGGELVYPHKRDGADGFVSIDGDFMDLPFALRDVFRDVSIHRNAYVFTRHESYADTTTKGRVWLLSPNGQIQSRDMPAGEWGAGSVRYHAIKDGWLIRALTRGLYLAVGEQVTKIASGGIRDAAVSPNGCNVAVKMNFANERGYPVRLISFCRERELIK
ncbi:MAG: hypothetical protein EHM80_06135 [Nitrospiraceae bacterium]|nr:MAG: hypothetical protein EHM80_06135 [Nitrospiraceae bacterium]